MAEAIINIQHKWLEVLQRSGYRLTQPMQCVVAVMGQTQRALSPLDVYDLGRAIYPRLGLVTVYRTLEKMEDLGLVERVHHPSGCHLYLRAAQGHEHLMVCLACGRAEYFAGDDLSELMARVTRSSGFKIQEHWLQFYGLCQRCQE
jgi:Fur family transcriptional regulator, ferric uptake regulator